MYAPGRRGQHGAHRQRRPERAAQPDKSPRPAKRHGSRQASTPIKVRENFDALAAFVPALTHGRVRSRRRRA